VRRFPSPHRGGAPGFTLIELVVTIAVAGIVMAMITQIVYTQTRSFADQMGYSEAQQNARASIALLKRYARNAGWSMAASSDQVGILPFGSCHQNAPNDVLSMTACNNIDLDNQNIPGTDRLRVVGMQQTGGGVEHEQPFQIPPGTVPVGLLADPVTLAALAAPAGQPFTTGELVLLSGPCIGGGGGGTDLLRIAGDNGAPANHHFNYTYTNVMLGGTNLSCAAGYDLGHSVGRAVVADFFIDRTSDPSHPSLRLRLDPTTPLSDAYVVAWDIDDLQVQFFVDTQCTDAGCATAIEPDHVWDTVCNSPTDVFCDQPVSGFTDVQILSRVIGARIAIVTRTRAGDLRWKYPTPSTITVQDNPIIGDGDGYRRWIYRATVMLRNNEL